MAHLQRTSNLQLRFFKLDQFSLRMLVYVDASFNNEAQHLSQLGNIIFLSYKSNRCSFLHFASCKNKRVTGSSTAAETPAFVLGFDVAFLLRHDIHTMLGQHIPTLMLTDPHQLFTALTPAKMTTARRLMIEIESVREAYHDRTIANVALIRSAENFADGMTKLAPNASLLHLLRHRKINNGILQYIIERK